MISAFVFYRLIYLLKKKRKKYARVRLHVSYLLRYLSMGIIQKTSIEIFCSLNKKKKKKEGKTTYLTDKRMYIFREMHYRADCL